MAREDVGSRSQVAVETYRPSRRPTQTAAMPWWVAAIGGAMVSALVGWAVLSALVLIAQIGEKGAVEWATLRVSTQFWLLSHGGVIEIDSLRLTLIPLAFTAIIAFVIYRTAGYAGRQLVLAGEAPSGVGVAKVASLVMAAYAVIVTTIALLIDAGHLRAGLGAIVVGGVMGYLGASRTIKWRLGDIWPTWAQAIPRAVGAGILVSLVGGVAVLVTGLILARDQVIGLTTRLNPDWVGGVILALIQLFFAINLIIWCTSWAFGPGFSLGDGSAISLVGSQVGLLPAFPVTAAVPTEVSAWWLVWLAVPVFAGVAAALMILRARPRARFDETALVGGLSGALSGIGVGLLALASRGSIGVDRMVDLGPFVLPLLVIAPSLMGIAGLVTGLVVGLFRPGRDGDTRWWARWGPDPEETTVIVIDPDATVGIRAADARTEVKAEAETRKGKAGRKGKTAKAPKSPKTPKVPKSKAQAKPTTADGELTPTTERITPTTGEQLPLDFFGGDD